MAMTLEDGIRNIRYFMETYLPSRPDIAEGAVRVFTSTVVNLNLSVEYAYKDFIDYLPIDVGFYARAFPGYEVDQAALADPIAYGYTIPAALIVDFYYPDAPAAERDLLVRSLESGAIDHYDFLQGWTAVAPEDSRPPAAVVLHAIHASGHGNPELPALPLAFDGLAEDEVAFLVGVYVAAFSRAPEHDGLAYWAQELADGMGHGAAPADAHKHVAALMYASGRESGESGPELDDAGYIDHLYRAALGRPADPDGGGYWLSHLAQGGDRGEFIAVLLASGLASAGDDAYLQARIAVAGHAAQPHISGDPQHIDLAEVLAGVYNAATARAAIDLMDAGVFQTGPVDIGTDAYQDESAWSVGLDEPLVDPQGLVPMATLDDAWLS